MRTDPKRTKMEVKWQLHWCPFSQPASEHITEDMTNDGFKLRVSWFLVLPVVAQESKSRQVC